MSGEIYGPETAPRGVYRPTMFDPKQIARSVVCATRDLCRHEARGQDVLGVLEIVLADRLVRIRREFFAEATQIADAIETGRTAPRKISAALEAAGRETR
jgi:hypothetical protein